MPTWYRGRDAVEVFLREFAFAKTWAAPKFVAGERRVKLVPLRASGHIAFGAYHYKDEAGAHLPTALQVLSLRGGEIEEITGYVEPALFSAFGLPDRLPAGTDR
jgi:RNA polymerase sigma-70 factor (ECF subfamily)